MGPRCYLVFGSKLFTDCSLAADWSAAALSNVEHLHQVAFDGKQDAIDVRAATIHRSAHAPRAVVNQTDTLVSRLEQEIDAIVQVAPGLT